MDIENKVLIFGGWKPYKNLSNIQVYDIKDNALYSLSKLKDQMSGKSLKVVSINSASTKNESDGANSSVGSNDLGSPAFRRDF